MNDEANRHDAWTGHVDPDVAPPAAVRARVIANLREEGLLREPAQRRPSPAWLRVAAVLVVFAAGFAIYAVLEPAIGVAGAAGAVALIAALGLGVFAFLMQQRALSKKVRPTPPGRISGLELKYVPVLSHA